MIDNSKFYDILHLELKTEYKVVCFEGGTATFPPKFMADPLSNVAEK